MRYNLQPSQKAKHVYMPTCYCEADNTPDYADIVEY